MATRSKMSVAKDQYIVPNIPRSQINSIPFTNEFRIDMARVEIPVSGWTCLRTAETIHVSEAASPGA